MNSPAARLEIVRPAVPVDLDGAVLAGSWSNDTWLTSRSVLRVCWRGDRQRLLREGMLLESLPSVVPHAAVLATGCTEGLTWMVARRIPGERLDLVWPRLSGEERRDAVVSLAGAVKALHEWEPSSMLSAELRRAASAAPVTPDDIVGSAIVPLPVARLLPLLGWLDEQPGMDRVLAGRVRRRVEDLRPLISDAEFEDGVVVHGDACYANVLWHQGRLAALLDLEWARLGPPDLEVATILGDDPDMQAGEFSGAVSAAEVPALAWLRAGYPELFDRRHLTERVWLYDLCFRIRQICASGGLDPSSRQNLAGLTMHPKMRFR